ncbi:O-antigen ligase family protein [Butyrivibrio sp. AD3002]|uniref:O-antigen ligase family protein n=1 Tax=Butyrivibrio sp. AD3002 TaxID=1280670 RepID=UPI0003B72A55|nr:O-antigen ligase family protein [Butyrivibrio sp. AD3002]
MRRKVVYRSAAIRAVILIFAFLAIVSVFPLRIWQRTITERGGGDIVQTSDRVNDYHDVVQKFIAQYDRLESIDIYVDSVELGNYMSLVFYNENMEEVYQRFVYLRDAELPGYLNVRVGLDLNVGENYTMILNGAFSTYYVAYEHAGEDTSPYFVSFAYHDTGVEGVQLAAKYNYTQPLSKKVSGFIILVVILLAAALLGLQKLIFADKEDPLISVHKVIKYVGNPIAAVMTLAMMILIWPMKYFDIRPVENLFLELGVIIAAGFVFYAINHESDATLDVKLWHNVKNILQMSAIAAAIWFCCEYMNALYTIYQTLAERKEMICLLIFLCLLFPADRIFKEHNVYYCAVAIVLGVIYRIMHLLPETEKEYDLHNAAMTYGVIVVILAGFILLNFAVELYHRVHEKAEKKAISRYKISIFGIVLLVFFAVLVVFRNTRWWGVALAAFVIGLMLSYWLYGFKEYSELIIGGLLLNFVVSMLYCWMYRSFAAFNTGRYAFVFHTVTITAEYMTVMECASAVLLLYKIYLTREMTSFAARIKYLWKEFILFGFVTSYMMFTISRTSYLACLVMFICMFVLTSGDCKKGKLRYLGIQIGTMALAVILSFPAAFMLQRTMPAIVARPKKFLVETGNFGLYGGGQPDSHLYMSIERFVDLFAEKILNIDVMDYNYPEDIENYNSKGKSTIGENGVPLTEDQSDRMMYTLPEIVASKQTDPEIKEYLMETGGNELFARMEAEAAAAEAMVSADSGENTDEVQEENAEENSGTPEDGIEEFSNGRITIFKAYLKQMTPFGHDEMGAELPSGEIAVHAHNTYLQVMYDNGILAGIVFFLMFVCAFFSGIIFYLKNRDYAPGALFAFAMIVGVGVAALSEWVFQFSNPMAVALLMALMPIAFKNRKSA